MPSPMLLTIRRCARRDRQARAFCRLCLVALLVSAVAVTVLGIAQTLDLIHLHELALLTQTVTQ